MLQYLQRAKSVKLVYPCDIDFNLLVESEAYWRGNKNDRRSSNRYLLELGKNGGSISSQTRKQPLVALSSFETEYQDLAAATQEALFLKNLLTKMNYSQEVGSTIGENSQCCIKLTTYPVFHKPSKHFDTNYAVIGEKIEVFIQLQCTRSHEWAADLSTKPLPQLKVGNIAAGYRCFLKLWKKN